MLNKVKYIQKEIYRIMDNLIKNNIEQIAQEGARIYEQIKSEYDPRERGKFLAIEVDSKKVYFGNTSIEAMELAKKNHPDKIFYVVKIGFDVIETLSQLYR